MIPMKSNLRVAEAVLAVIQASIHAEEDFGAWIECFDNCREQGYVIKHYSAGRAFHVAFSENRSSDDIVVYTYYDCAFPHNNPKDWESVTHKTFRYDAFGEAAKYILGILKERTPKKENAA